MRRSHVLLVAAIAVGWSLSGCSNDDDSSASNTSSSSGAGATGAGGSGMAGSGGATTASGGNGPAGDVDCSPTLVCSGGEVCCVPLSVSVPQECATLCQQGFSPISCDGPEDCNGSACCGTVTDGFACSTNDTCAGGEGQRCHDAADCPAGKLCIDASAAGDVPLDTCEP